MLCTENPVEKNLKTIQTSLNLVNQKKQTPHICFMEKTLKLKKGQYNKSQIAT